MNRIIIHIDMNSYFASVEQQANPFLRGKPIGITGKRAEAGDYNRSIITTASIEAKRLGVKTAMSAWEAKKICPSLLLIAGDPEKYSELMHRFNKVYREFTHLVQQFSIDESFLDITDTAKDYLGATLMAQMIRYRLREELGERVTASIGIAQNKLMAKLACESVKPNGLTVLRPGNEIPFLDTRALQDLCGIGPRIYRRLNRLGIRNFRELREYPAEGLIAEFKSYGLWLHRAAHGIDDSPVDPREDEPKSVGHSYTMPAGADDEHAARRYLLCLADKVAWRLRRDGYQAHCITAYIRYGDFTGVGKQRRFKEPIMDGLSLFKIAWGLIEEVRDDMKPIRLVGLSASQLTNGGEQQPLFKKERKMMNILPALDKIQTRYGTNAWTRASLLPIEFKPRSSGFHFDHEV